MAKFFLQLLALIAIFYTTSAAVFFALPHPGNFFFFQQFHFIRFNFFYLQDTQGNVTTVEERTMLEFIIQKDHVRESHAVLISL